MRKFLSLVLALVMMMSLVTINAGAKEFSDDDDLTYKEAVDVISTIKVVDGYNDGSFRPGAYLSRGAAAKIICNMILGPTTAAELHADTAPYRDVPLTNEFSGYIAYCQKEGIINGYNDGTFRPTGTLTGYAFMKMLLGALGYDGEIEQYTGPNWSINVAKRAIGIGLNDGLEKTFNGVEHVTREEAALYAFNTLQADLVEYSSKITANVNGAEVTVGNSTATSRTWQSQMSRNNYIRNDDIIQFAEEYFNKLEKRTGEDEFERPAYTWIYDKEEIGTYVDWSLMVAEYTDEVTGRELYDLLTSSLLNDDDMSLVYYVNGVQPVANCGMNTFVFDADHPDDGTSNITKLNNTITRSNKNAVGFTGLGVLTQVFVDKDNRESIIITSIDTWLAKGGADYDSEKETAPIDVYMDDSLTDADPDKTYNVDVEDVPTVADVAEEDFYLVTISFKNDLADGEIITIEEPEILDESVITKFSTDNVKDGAMPSKVTTNGTEYKLAVRGYYDPSALDEYDVQKLTDQNYNIVLDPYGNMIGIELNEGVKQYVFITGFDRPQSNLSIKTADAAGIFLDGTMAEIKVNVTKTDENILAVNEKASDRTAHGYVSDNDGSEYFLPWQTLTTELGQDGFHALNRWYTYSVNDAGVYTLKPATNMVIYYSEDASHNEILKTDNLYLDDTVMYDDNNYRPHGTKDTFPYANISTGSDGTKIGAGTVAHSSNLDANFPYTALNKARCYGNDDSVYITVDTDIVDTRTGGTGSITDVSGVYTGAQSVEIELDRNAIEDKWGGTNEGEGDVFAVFDKNNYIIGAVTVGEANGGNATIAYVTSGVKSERIENGVYYWEFEAVLDGTVKTLTVKENYGSVIGSNAGSSKSTVTKEADEAHKALATGTYAGSNRDWNLYDGIVELRFDSDGYVVSVKNVDESKIYSYFGTKENQGGNSIVSSDDQAAWTVTQTDRMSKYNAYRIGGVSKASLGSRNTWTATKGTFHHYDSAPEELTLRGRTLYVTSDQSDEGLALSSDAKAVVIQRENGKWKTREFTNVSSAVAQVADANTLVNGKQFNGEIVANLNGSGQATWVVITSYTDVTSGSSNIRQGLVGIYMDNNYGAGTPTWVHTAASGGNPNRSTVDITLVGTNDRQAYTVELQTWSNYTNSWNTVLTIPVVAHVGTNTTVGGHLGYNVTVASGVNVGALNNGSLYRLSCQTLVTPTVEQATY